MTKYSNEFKVKAIKMVLKGNSISHVAKIPNVVVAGMASAHGEKLSFISYLKIAFPLMILSIIVASIYVYIRYL